MRYLVVFWAANLGGDYVLQVQYIVSAELISMEVDVGQLNIL